MGRVLVVLGILFLVWIAYRFLQKSWSERLEEVAKQEAFEQNNRASSKVQPIKACAYCKTHILEDEGIYENAQFFCSYQHLDHYIEHQKKSIQ
jgi:Na+-transporting methylmalonyl-CoA/oxaloacetate decarboxylase gamma subunit